MNLEMSFCMIVAACSIGGLAIVIFVMSVLNSRLQRRLTCSLGITQLFLNNDEVPRRLLKEASRQAEGVLDDFG